MSKTIELSEHGRFLFEERNGSRFSGVVEELTTTSVRIRWDNSGNAVWYALTKFMETADAHPEYAVIEKLKPQP